MVHIFPNEEEMSQAAALYIARVGERSVAERGRFELVLSGGKTPCETYRILAEMTRSDRGLWGNTHVFWGDERFVPKDHPESNYGIAKGCLLDVVPIPPGQIHRIPGEAADPQQAAAEYDMEFPATPDLLLLGMGKDGHTASLFPGSPALDEVENRFSVALVPVEPRLRITLTPPGIASARLTLVLAAHSNKAGALRRVFETVGAVSKTPARLAREATWYVDQDAAAQIRDLDIRKSIEVDSGQGTR